MNKVILQLWEESNTNDGFLSDGCSLHISLKERDYYVSTVYKNRDLDTVPDSYDRIVGEFVEVFVDDDIFQTISESKTIKINEPSFQNLLKFEKIILNQDNI